jgi:hypothetical protein
MTPAKKTQPIADAILEPATPLELIKALVRALGHEPADVAAIEIRPRNVRVYGKDRSLRSHTVNEWSAKEEGADE